MLNANKKKKKINKTSDNQLVKDKHVINSTVLEYNIILLLFITLSLLDGEYILIVIITNQTIILGLDTQYM